MPKYLNHFVVLALVPSLLVNPSYATLQRTWSLSSPQLFFRREAVVPMLLSSTVIQRVVQQMQRIKTTWVTLRARLSDVPNTNLHSSRGYQGFPDDLENSPYRSVIQRAMDEEAQKRTGRVQAVRWVIEGLQATTLVHEGRDLHFGEATSDTLEDLARIPISPTDLAILKEKGTTIVLIDDLDAEVSERAAELGLLARGQQISGAHYSLSRNQIYLDSRLIHRSPHLRAEFRRQLHHELDEQISVISALDAAIPNWRNRRGDHDVRALITQTADQHHVRLKSEENYLHELQSPVEPKAEPIKTGLSPRLRIPVDVFGYEIADGMYLAAANDVFRVLPPNYQTKPSQNGYADC